MCINELFFDYFEEDIVFLQFLYHIVEHAIDELVALVARILFGQFDILVHGYF